MNNDLKDEVIAPEIPEQTRLYPARKEITYKVPNGYNMQILAGWRRRLTDLKVAVHILLLAIRNYGSVNKSLKALSALYSFKKSILGGIETKLVKLNNKFYHSLYAPGYPSVAFDNYIEAELNRILPINKKTNNLSFLFFAITGKCPLQCEHCFEWNNLNKAESFTLTELQNVVTKFQKEGIAQFHLSGGEPMVRVKDLVQVINLAGEESEFYVLTSGFNFKKENAKALRLAGLTGVVISLDHHDSEKHNAFRGFQNSFNDVISAVQNAQEQNLVVALSLCATRTFTTWDNLVRYAALAKDLKVSFIQILEPKAIGHYESKDVVLDESHFTLLDDFYRTFNFNKVYSKYPVVIYHGYYQRRVGCLAGGNRTLYIDPQGYVNACPFCNTKNYNIKDALIKDEPLDTLRKMGCAKYLNA